MNRNTPTLEEREAHLALVDTRGAEWLAFWRNRVLGYWSLGVVEGFWRL